MLKEGDLGVKSGLGFYKWIKEDEEFKQEVEELQNVVLDFAESTLHKLIADGNLEINDSLNVKGGNIFIENGSLILKDDL